MKHAVILVICCLVASTAVARQRTIRPDSVTVTGVVTCEGQPMKGIVVSDGVEFDLTDENGKYELKSRKFQGNVFLISPAGYTPVCRKGILPMFWANLDTKHMDECEQHDFELEKVDDTNHCFIVSAGFSLAGRNDDLLQFKRMVIPAVRRTAEKARRDSMAVYSVVLGDISINNAWYSSDFDISDAMRAITMFRYPTPLYTVIGDADHDGATAFGGLTDYNSERLYTITCGPKYYSMNIGAVHYVVLDDTVFLNEPGEGNYSTDIVGKRNYNRFVTIDQIQWLRRDLSYVRDTSTPIVVFTHNPVFRTSNKGDILNQFTQKEQMDTLLDCFKGRRNVHFYTANSNRRRVSIDKARGITEHNIPNASGNTWDTAYSGYRHLCSDGTAPGYEVLTARRDSLTWHYETEMEGDRQFRIYDMDAVSKYYAADYDIRGFFKEYKVRTDYSSESFRGYVYINYWGYEPGSKLEVTENGEKRKVKSVMQDDPMYTVSGTITSYHNNRGRQRKSSYGKSNCQHMFRFKCEKDSSTVVVKSTDPFGQVSVDSIVRPAPFDLKGGIPRLAKNR